jgi:serine/threonine-protein kinase
MLSRMHAEHSESWVGDPRLIVGTPASALRTIGEVFAEFNSATQDSGNISYGLAVGGRKYFVKTPGLPGSDTIHALSHERRSELLRKAAEMRGECDHPLLPRLHRLVEAQRGPLLVYDWVEGELLRRATLDRFRMLPVERVLSVLDGIYDLHRMIAAAGWVAHDFYDGCLIYDFAAHQLHVMDLDCYHRGPVINPGLRFGSDRFMAPEEMVAGELIDQRSTVYTLGRTAAVLLCDGTLRSEAFRGEARQLTVVSRACEREPGRRHQDVAAFVRDWSETRSARQ